MFSNERENTKVEYIAFKEAKTVNNGLVGVFGLHYTPNLRIIYLWFEDRRRDGFTLQKSTQPGCSRSVIGPSTTQTDRKWFTGTPRCQ